MTELLTQSRVRWGGRVTIGGRLTNRDGHPLAGEQVQVLGSAANGEQLLAVLTTNAQGEFSYRAAGSASRILRFVHAGTSTILPAESRVALVVPAAGSSKPSRKRPPNGGRLVFRGVASLPLPAAGKLIELQVRQPDCAPTSRPRPATRSPRAARACARSPYAAQRDHAHAHERPPGQHGRLHRLRRRDQPSSPGLTE